MIRWIGRLLARALGRSETPEPHVDLSFAAAFAELERESNQLVEDEIRRYETQWKATGG
jgi:hypothetical protein